MRRFFDREDTRWRRGNGALHFYLAPPEDSPLWDLVREAEKPLSALPQIGIQPPECIHVTVQRLDLYRDEISDAQWEKLRSQMDRRMAQIAPFTLTFAPPAVQERAVEVISPENPSFTRLIDAVRDSIVDAGLGEALTDPPFGPHFSLAYAVAGTSSEEDRALADALHALKTDNSMECSQIALVEVDQDQEAGIFSFRPLYTWTVGTPR